MRVLRIDESSPHTKLIGVGGIGTGIFFDLASDDTLGRNESRPGRLLDVRDYCKLHIVIHYIATLLGAHVSGLPFHVMPVGRVGDDAAGHLLIDEMAQAGIDTSSVDTAKGQPTLFSVCFQYPDGSGGNITTNNSAASSLCSKDVDHVAGLLQTGARRTIALAVPEAPLDVRHYFMKVAAHAKNFLAASFVPAEISAAREAGIFQLLDLVSLNEEEAQELIGCSFSSVSSESFVAQCQAFLRTHCPNLRLVFSVGKNGAYGVTVDRFHYCPAPVVEVASTAGAGDSLLGGTIAALAAGLPFLRTDCAQPNMASSSVETALELGVLLASYKCSSPHTIHPLASIATLETFAREVERPFSSQLQELIAATNSE